MLKKLKEFYKNHKSFCYFFVGIFCVFLLLIISITVLNGNMINGILFSILLFISLVFGVYLGRLYQIESDMAAFRDASKQLLQQVQIFNNDYYHNDNNDSPKLH